MVFGRTLFGIMLLGAAVMMAGCHGHGAGAVDPKTRTVSGYVSQGIIKNGTVIAYKMDSAGNKILPLLAQTTSNDTGFYTMSIGTYYGPFSVEASGNYTDEATGQPATINPAHPLRAATVPPFDATPVILNVTALTEIAYAQATTVSGGLTDNINAMNGLVSKCFLVQDICTTRPLDASTALPLSASDFQKQYTLVLAAVSQLAAGNLATATPTTLELATALAKALDDLSTQLPANSTLSALVLQTTIAGAAMTFLDSPANKTGLTSSDPSIQNVLAASRTVSGYASKGIIKNGTVIAYKMDSAGNKILPLLAQTTSDDSGFYSISIGTYYGPIVVEAFGNYRDEATGQTASIDPSAPLKAATVPPNDATPVTMNVTALTKIAFDQTQSRSADFTAGINAANQQVSSSFQVPDILTTRPLDASTTLSATASSAEKQYTLVLAAVSQVAANNLPTGTTAPSSQQLATALSSALTTLTEQLPTGGTAATTLQITVATAATQFVSNQAVNTTGITAADPAAQTILSASTRKNVAVTITLSNSGASVPAFGAVHGTLTLPVGMVCQANAVTGELQGSLVNALQAGSMVSGNFKASSRVLTVQAIRAAGLALGDLLTVTCDVPSDMIALVGDVVVNNAALDVNDGGVSLPGFTLAVSW